ncbi:uncharacterized protein LJ206_001084 [Theristicus caerulescens]
MRLAAPGRNGNKTRAGPTGQAALHSPAAAAARRRPGPERSGRTTPPAGRSPRSSSGSRRRRPEEAVARSGLGSAAQRGPRRGGRADTATPCAGAGTTAPGGPRAPPIRGRGRGRRRLSGRTVSPHPEAHRPLPATKPEIPRLSRWWGGQSRPRCAVERDAQQRTRWRGALWVQRLLELSPQIACWCKYSCWFKAHL